MSATPSGRRALLLIRESPVQIYCANTLFRHGAIDRVFVEQGRSVEPEGWALVKTLWRYGPSGIVRRVARDFSHFGGNALTCLDYYATRLATRGLMGRRRFHEANILGDAARGLDAGLHVVRGASINDDACRQLIRQHGYRLVFVFGTGLLKEPVLSESGATFVNLHWGLAPRYRGEGIISALAADGAQGLGVTVHLIDRGIDSGPILYQERLMPKPGDNVYAIGLKFSVLGTPLFLRVCEEFHRGGLRAIPQALGEGTLCLSAHLKTHYRRLRTAQRVLANLGTPRAWEGGRPMCPGEDRTGTEGGVWSPTGMPVAPEDYAPTGATSRPPVGVGTTTVAPGHGRGPMAGSRSGKAVLAWGARMTGAAALARRRHGGRLRVLMYHGVVPRLRGPATFGDLFISAEAFARQMRHLRRVFTVLSLDQVIDLLEAHQPFPDRAVAVTFDDGYRNTLTSALPVLERFRVPAAVFVTPGQMAERGIYWFDALRVVVAGCAHRRSAVDLGEGLSVNGRLMQEPEEAFLALARRISVLPPSSAEAVTARLVAMTREDRRLKPHPEFALATWDEWRQGLAGGLIAVGSHGMRHGDLLAMSPEEQLNDLRQSRLAIERALSTPCRAVAYPHGRWDARVAEAAAVAGYACGLTTDDGLNDSGRDPFTLCRTMVGDKGSYALFCARVSGLWGRLRVGQG